MRNLKHLLMMVLPLLLAAACTAPDENDMKLQPVLEVFHRTAPWTDGKVKVEYLELPDSSRTADAYEYRTAGGKLLIRATSIPAAGAAFNHYLMYSCHRSFSMTGANLAPLDRLPRVKEPVKAATDCRYRHFFNFCTLNYSGSFWDWKDWERMIDYMVLHGVNLTIATTGLEKVWYNTLSEFGFTEEEIFAFLPGPAFNAWHIMGNQEGWGGPITKNMMEKRSRLGRQILDRLRECQIAPISSAFYGMVPTALKEKYPEAEIVPQGNWVGGFVRPDILSPLDPLYGEMAAVYYGEMKRLYGDISFFAGEPFHEGGIREGIDIADMAWSVFSRMRQVNPSSRWFLQAWGENPTSEFLSRFSREDDVLIWDFRGEQSAEWERRGGYEGFPFLWGVINNFGETTGLYGKLERFVTEYFRSATAYPDNMVGLGCSAEGILNNPVNYDLLFEIPWHGGPFSVREWLEGYVAARYGSADEAMTAVWNILLDTAYSSLADASKADPISKELPQIVGTPESYVCAMPCLDIRSASAWGTSELYYRPEEFRRIVPHLIDASERLAYCDAFQYDLVNLTRQLLSNEFHRHYDAYVAAVGKRDLSVMDAEAAAMKSLLTDMEDLLKTRREFMLGSWIADARAFGDNEAEKELCQWNAKAQVSYWGGERNDTSLRDYAHKEWAGLISGLYLPRWERFFNYMRASVSGEDTSALPGISEKDFTQMSIDWSHRQDPYPEKTEGDPVAAALRILSAHFLTIG